MKIILELFVKNYNGVPKIKIHSDETLLHETHITKSGKQILEFETNMTFPTQLIIEHYGKDMKRDTKLLDGKIIDDKGFVLEKVHIGDCVLENELHIFDFIKTNGDILNNNNYIGYNGKYCINIDSDNLIDWYFKLQKKFINQQEDFDYENFKNEIFGGQNYKVDY